MNIYVYPCCGREACFGCATAFAVNGVACGPCGRTFPNRLGDTARLHAYIDGTTPSKSVRQGVAAGEPWAQCYAAQGLWMGLKPFIDTFAGDRDVDSAAARLFHDAAVHGDSEAAFRVGQCFEHGRGVGRDLHHAFSWYRKAAEHVRAL